MRTIGCMLLVAWAGVAHAEPLNHAAGFGWPGYLDTDLQFSAFVGSDHTIVLRFLPQYTMANEGPLVAASGSGTYTLGIADYRAGSASSVKLELAVGGTTGYYTLGNPATDCDPRALENEWHMLAIVRSGTTLKLYLDGKRKDTDAGGNLSPSAADFTGASGVLRIGKRTASDETQFFGFVDDVAVFDQALSKDQLDSIFASNRLDKTAANLHPLRAWTFDDKLPNDDPLPASFAHAVTYQTPAYLTLVSQHRDDAFDVKLLPLSFQKSRMILPFERGVAWTVAQPNEGLASHNGHSAAFSWDFVRDDDKTFKVCPSSGDNSSTCSTRVVAHADGTLTDGCDLGDPPDAAHLDQGCASSASQFASDGKLIDGYDWVHINDATDETAVYQHVLKGSLGEQFPAHASDFKSPLAVPPAAPLTIHVESGDRVARAGTSGANNCHLHFSVGKTGVSTTPVAFSNYELWDPVGKSWTHVDKGIPKAGQTVRRPQQESASPSPASPSPSPASCVCLDGTKPAGVSAGTQQCTTACHGHQYESCVCPDGFKAGPTVHEGSAACEHICRGHERP